MTLAELGETIRLLEIRLAEMRIKYATGEVGEEDYRRENETLEVGLSILKDESEKMKDLFEGTVPLETGLSKEKIEAILGELPMDRAFYFHTDYGQYTERYARSLREFVEAVRNVEPASLRFHLVRGDFQAWIRDLGDPELALMLDALGNLKPSDEELRSRIHEWVKGRVGLLEKKLKT